jgi:outer membrane protein OmpA-like peptidoglycan-associated protein
MYMSADNIRKYYKLATWVQIELPQIPHRKPKVWKAFERWFPRSGFPSDSVFLRWSMIPELDVQTFDRPTPSRCEEYVDAKGSVIAPWYRKRMGMTPGGGNLIFVAADIAARFDPRNPGLVTVAEATILHELIHWRRRMAGIDDGDKDPCYAFETEAYGREISRLWAECPPNVVHLQPNFVTVLWSDVSSGAIRLWNFEVGKHDLKDGHKTALGVWVLPFLWGGGSATVVGLASTTGESQNNREISERRADAVVAELRNQLGAPPRVATKAGLGESAARTLGVPDRQEDEGWRSVLVYYSRAPAPPPPRMKQR